MSLTNIIAPDFTVYPVWADRLAAFRGTEWQADALRTIANEAKRSGDMDYYDAALCASDGCEASLAELDQLIAEDAAEQSRMGWPADYFWRDRSSAMGEAA